MNKEQRFFVSSDASGHDYLVPVDRYTEWWAWRDISEDDERSWDVPDYAKHIDGGTLTFSDPKIESLGWTPVDAFGRKG